VKSRANALVTLACLLVGFLAPHALAEDATPILAVEEAEALYREGLETLERDPVAAKALFRASATRLESLRELGYASPETDFNLGNALVQAGELGRGIASYLRAERARPTDPRIAANLAHARSLVTRPIVGDAVRPAWAAAGSWWTPIPLGTRILLFAAFWVAAWIGFAIALRRRILGGANGSTSLRNASLASAALALAFGVTVALDLLEPRLRPLGVTTSDGSVLRKGNGEGFAPHIAERLVPGIEFRILEERPEWIRIRLPDGTEGWIRADQAERV